MPKNWEPEEIIKLIELYETNSVLWDAKAPEYKDRRKKNKIFEDIGTQLGCDGEEIQRKIHNLRNQVSQELRKTKNKQNGSGAEDFRSSWPYFNSLKFIIPGLIRDSQSNSKMAPSNISKGPDATENEKNGKNEHPSPKHAKKRKLFEKDDFETISSALRTIQKSDEYDSFGDYVASELRALRSDFIMRRLKSEIRKAIVRAADDDDLLTFGSVASTSTLYPECVLTSPPLDNMEQQSTT